MRVEGKVNSWYYRAVLNQGLCVRPALAELISWHTRPTRGTLLGLIWRELTSSCSLENFSLFLFFPLVSSQSMRARNKRCELYDCGVPVKCYILFKVLIVRRQKGQWSERDTAHNSIRYGNVWDCGKPGLWASQVLIPPGVLIKAGVTVLSSELHVFWKNCLIGNPCFFRVAPICILIQNCSSVMPIFLKIDKPK